MRLMAESSATASHVLKPCDQAGAATSNGIDLQSKIAEFSNQSLADNLAKCLTEVTAINRDLGNRLYGLVGDLVSFKGEWLPPSCTSSGCPSSVRCHTCAGADRITPCIFHDLIE